MEFHWLASPSPCDWKPQTSDLDSHLQRVLNIFLDHLRRVLGCFSVYLFWKIHVILTAHSLYYTSTFLSKAGNIIAPSGSWNMKANDRMPFWTLVIFFCFSKTSIGVKRIQIITTFSTDARCNNTKPDPKMPCRLLTFRQLYKRKWVPSSHGNRKTILLSSRASPFLLLRNDGLCFRGDGEVREGQSWPNKPFTPASLEWTCYRVITDWWPANTAAH